MCLITFKLKPHLADCFDDHLVPQTQIYKLIVSTTQNLGLFRRSFGSTNSKLQTDCFDDHLVPQIKGGIIATLSIRTIRKLKVVLLLH